MDVLSIVSGGLVPAQGTSLSSAGYSANISGGFLATGLGELTPQANITPATTAAYSLTNIPTSISAQINALISPTDPYGHAIVPTASGFVDLGASANGSLIGTNNILSQLGNNAMLSSKHSNSGEQSFTGTDLRIIIQASQNTNSSQPPTLTSQLVECHTISISSYRVKNPVRSLGYTNPKGFSRGPRTIAGTMVLTEMSVDVLLTFLQSVVIADKSMNSNITKTDQLPPFNITMIFANEEGAASYRTLLGVELVNDGTVYSVQDMLIERTISWMALDFTPLLPLDVSSVFKANINNTSTASAQQTPTDLMAAPNKNPGWQL